MKEILDRVSAEEADGKTIEPQDHKGLTKPPLFDAIPVQNYLTPVLHACDLFVNSAKDNLDDFIDHRLEDRPIELLQARWLEADKKIKEREALSNYNDAKSLLDDAMITGDNDFIRRVTEMVKEAEASYKAAKRAFGKAAAAAQKMEGKKVYGAMSQALRQQVDELLAELFNILRSSYHGGDMEGNYCRKLIRLADDTMDAIESLLLTVPRNQRAPGCTDAEVEQYCAAYKRLLQYFDLLSSYCYHPYKTITDSEMENIKKLGAFMDQLWRKLSQKKIVTRDTLTTRDSLEK